MWWWANTSLNSDFPWVYTRIFLAIGLLWIGRVHSFWSIRFPHRSACQFSRARHPTCSLSPRWYYLHLCVPISSPPPWCSTTIPHRPWVPPFQTLHNQANTFWRGCVIIIFLLFLKVSVRDIVFVEIVHFLQDLNILLEAYRKVGLVA